MVVGNLGEVRLLQGRLDQARSSLSEAIVLAERIGSLDEALEGRRRLAQVTLAEGDPARALADADRWLADARAQGNAAEEGNLLRIRGEALLALGRTDASCAALARAASILKESGGALDQARVALSLARSRLQMHPSEPARLIDEARSTCQRLGAAGLLREAQALEAAARRLGQAGADSAQKLVQIAQELTFEQELDLDRLLEKVTDRALEMTGADRGLIILFDEGNQARVHAARWREEDLRDSLSVRISRTIADRVYCSGDPIVITDVAADAGLSQSASIAAMELRCVMCVPMTVRGTTVGILHVDSRQASRSFTEDELAVLVALASQSAVAVQNARLFETERRRRRLVADMAHDFRTPLTALKSTFELVIASAPDLDEELRSLIAAARDQITRLDRMSAEVVGLEQIRQGEAALKPLPMDPAYAIELTLLYLLPVARKKGVELTAAPDPGLPPVLADSDAFTRILTNLVGNALRFVSDGGRIEVRARVTDEPGPAAPSEGDDALGWTPSETRSAGPRIQFEVRDNGVGIPPEQRAKIFERFVHGARSEGGRTGVGLAIVSDLVRRQGGRVWLDSTVGEGTSFYFALPVASSE